MEEFGIKELYDIRFKAIDPLTFCGREYESGEVLLKLDRATYSVITTSKAKTVAEGGHGNKILIHWDEVKPMRMQLQQGILSKEKLSLLTNNIIETGNIVEFSVSIKIENELGGKPSKKLKYPIKTNLPYFLYTNTGQKIDKNEYSVLNNELTFKEESQGYPEAEYFILDYKTEKDSETLRIGVDSFEGFLELEAKTRVKDDTTGQEKTGIFIIPQLRIMSDLSMQLGDAIAPYLYTFTIEAEPVGPRREEYVCELHFLNEDLDADI